MIVRFASATMTFAVSESVASDFACSILRGRPLNMPKSPRCQKFVRVQATRDRREGNIAQLRTILFFHFCANSPLISQPESVRSFTGLQRFEAMAGCALHSASLRSRSLIEHDLRVCREDNRPACSY